MDKERTPRPTRPSNERPFKTGARAIVYRSATWAAFLAGAGWSYAQMQMFRDRFEQDPAYEWAVAVSPYVWALPWVAFACVLLGHNAVWKFFDRRHERKIAAPGRTTPAPLLKRRIGTGTVGGALAFHSLFIAAVLAAGAWSHVKLQILRDRHGQDPAYEAAIASGTFGWWFLMVALACVPVGYGIWVFVDKRAGEKRVAEIRATWNAGERAGRGNPIKDRNPHEH